MTHTNNDYYQTLELPLNASTEDIRIRYLQMARVYHPDRYSDPGDKEFVEEMMKRINEAYSALTHAPHAYVAPLPKGNSSLAYRPVYKTVKGVPPGFALILAMIAFLLGAITVQFFNFIPLTAAIDNNLRANSSPAMAKAEVEPARASVKITENVTIPTVATASPTPTTTLSSQTPVGEPLVMAANGVTGAFPQSSKLKMDTTTATIEAEPATSTPQPTATTAPTETATPLPTDTPVPTDTPEPTATETLLPPTSTVIAPAPSNVVATQNGVLLTISVSYNVFARTTTSIQSEAAALLSIGDQVLVVGRTIDNYWLRIVLSDGRPAWLYAETVGMDSATVSALPVVTQ